MSNSADKNAAVRRTVLDAARTCFERYGVARTRVEDVAAAAGISRPLLYLHFDGRAGLIEALINDEIPRFTEANGARIPTDAGFAEAIIEGSLAAIEITGSNELLADLMHASPMTSLMHLYLDRSRPAYLLALNLWKPVFDKGRETGELRADLSDDDLLEWLMCVQYVLLERPDLDTDRKRELIRMFVVPALLNPPTA